MNKKAIFLDVDGTLVAGHMEMSDKVKEAITKARLNGHKVFICTGRNKAGIKKELESVEFDGIVASAGSYVEINNKVIHSAYFDKLLVDKITNIFNTNNIFYNYECTDMTFMSDEMVQLFVGGVNFDKGNSELERLRAQQHDKFNIKDMSCYTNQKIHKICFISLDQEVLNQAVRMLEQDVNVIIHDMFDVTTINGELISKINNKATGIQYAIDYLNIDKENTIAFGDSMNDYQMIEAAGYGIVSYLAPEKLKAIADDTFEDPDNDGIYKCMKQLKLI